MSRLCSECLRLTRRVHDLEAQLMVMHERMAELELMRLSIGPGVPEQVIGALVHCGYQVSLLLHPPLEADTAKRETCRGCGCTDDRACRGGCYWSAPGLCSQCAKRGVK